MKDIYCLISWMLWCDTVHWSLQELICDRSVQRVCYLHTWDDAQGTLHIKMGCVPTPLTPRPKPAAKSAAVQNVDNLLAVLCFCRNSFGKSTFSHYLQKTWDRAGLSIQQAWVSQFQVSECS